MTNRTIFIISGIVLLLGGIWALFAPFAASMAAIFYVGAAFATAGGLHIVMAFQDEQDRIWNGGFGILGVLLGLSFFLNPFAGLISLTIVLGALFFASGLMQLYLAYKRRSTDSVWMLGISGAVSILLAALIAFNVFTASVTVPGIILGIELITTGVAILLLRPRKDAELSMTRSERTSDA